MCPPISRLRKAAGAALLVATLPPLVGAAARPDSATGLYRDDWARGAAILSVALIVRWAVAGD